jgi:hypothetical protein
MRIIGIDYATDPRRVGLARAAFHGSSFALTDAEAGTTQEVLVDRIAEWLPPQGSAILPTDLETAKKEGWIRVAGRLGD